MSQNVRAAGRDVYDALRAFHEAMHADIMSRVLPAEEEEMVAPPTPVPKAQAPKKRPVAEPAPAAEPVAMAEPAPAAEPVVAKKPKNEHPPHPLCKGNYVAVPARPCKGGAKADKMTSLDDKPVCQTCKESIRRLIKKTETRDK